MKLMADSLCFQYFNYRWNERANQSRAKHRNMIRKNRKNAGKDIKVSFFGPVPTIQKNPELAYH